MENREVSHKEDIVCPFCRSVLLEKEVDDEFRICAHTIFVATDNGFEFIREDMRNIINENIEDEFDETIDNIDAYTAQLPIDGIRIADYTPAPGFLGAYWGFLGN